MKVLVVVQSHSVFQKNTVTVLPWLSCTVNTRAALRHRSLGRLMTKMSEVRSIFLRSLVGLFLHRRLPIHFLLSSLCFFQQASLNVCTE